MIKEYQPKNVMVVGSGGREDALIWMLRRSPHVGNIYAAPGNGGSERFADTKRLTVNINNNREVMQAAKDLAIDLVVVGPEGPLASGIIDELSENGVLGYGPDRRASQLEASKVFSAQFVEEEGIPHPVTSWFDDFNSAVGYLKKPGWEDKDKGAVVKASGLCAGKGTIVCDTYDEAVGAVRRIMVDREFGEAGKQVVIQEKLKDFEVSVMATVDGGKYVLYPFSEDHKQAFDNDQGPNTGGMGVASPHPDVDFQLEHKIRKKIIEPTIAGLRKRGIVFRGTLYPGIIVVNGEPIVVEYNARLGDPETQAVLPLLIQRDADFYQVLDSAAKGNLIFDGLYPKQRGSYYVVTLASGGYPGKYETGHVINGFDNISKDIVVFHAGTKKREDGSYETAGGRVLSVGGKRKEDVYGAIGDNGINFEKMHFRKDIGSRRR